MTGTGDGRNAIELESRFCAALECLPRTDRYHMKMGGGRAASLCGLQPRFLLTAAPHRSVEFPRNKRSLFSFFLSHLCMEVRSLALGGARGRVAASPTGCCEGQAALLAGCPLVHMALSILFQSPVCLLSSTFPIHERKGVSTEPLVRITH